MIIIDGPDGTGKTEFAKKIAMKLSMQYMKIHRNKNDIEQNGFKFYLDKAKTIPYNSVQDRFHLSEYVYPKLNLNDTRKPFKIWQQHMIERILLMRGCLLIYVDASNNFIEKVYQQRNDKILDIDKEKKLFSECLNNTLLPMKIYLTDLNNNDDQKIKIIEDWHNSINKKIPKFDSIGNYQNPIMFIGDDIKDSEYLHEALYIAGFKYPYYITNINNKNKNEFLKENYDINPRQIIAVGDKAIKLCNEIGISTNHRGKRISFYSLISPIVHQNTNGDIYDYANILSDIIW